MDSHEVRGRGRGRDRGFHGRTHGRSGGRFYRPRVTDPGLASHEGQEHLKYGEKRQDGNNPGDSSSCANVTSNSTRQNPIDSLADKETTRHMKPDISYVPSPIKGPETPLQNSSYASRPLPDHHKSQGRGFYRAGPGRSGGWRSSPPASHPHRPHFSDSGSSSHGGPERLNSGEKRRDGNSPSEPSSCASVESNQIRQNPADLLAEKGTIRPSRIKAPETPLQNSYSASRPHSVHMGSGSSSHEGQEKLNSGEQHQDANSPGEPFSCTSVKNYEIRENPADLLSNQGRINHLSRDRTSGPSPIRSPETSSTLSNSSSDSQPFLGHMDRRGGRGRGWQSSTSAPQRYPHGFTDPGLSSHRGQERVNIDGNSPNEPSSCASAGSNPIWQNPAADSMIDYAAISCRFANLDTSPGSSSIKGTGTPGSDGKSDNSKLVFDICLSKKANVIFLKPSLLDKNREKRKEIERTMERKNWWELRKGMILLKGYLSLSDQIKIVKQCRNLGVGRGGFYQPGYSDGGELQLKMMCLGQNWDPETRSYGDHRPRDGAKPPVIPTEFHQLVQQAIKYSHSLIEENLSVGTAEKQLPWMTPDVCIVNFYSSSGRLGLHQDRDESERSVRLGLPVVSFSIGDTAEFLYGDQRDVDKATVVNLESGDVLIFGGESRKVFHGVKAIKPDTAPKTLSSESNLRPGRLNLTFRQY